MLSAYDRPTTHLPAPTPQETLRWMAEFTQRGVADPRVRLLAEELVAGVMPHDYLSEYAAVLNWVRTNIRYTRDPAEIEQLKTVDVTLETRSADCDDLAVLLGALCGALGARVRFVAGGYGTKDPSGSPYSHVWCEVYDPVTKAWVVLDPVPGRRVGQMLNRLVDSLVQPVIG